MKATLTYLGRIVSLVPAELGTQFHDVCTVTVVKQDPPSAENGWQQVTYLRITPSTGTTPYPDGTPVFCAFSGYGYRFHHALTSQGHEVEIKDNLPCDLPERPDLTQFQGLEWRGSQGIVFAKLLANRMGVIDCPTGWGKSFIIRQLTLAYPKAKIAITVLARLVAEEPLRRPPQVGPHQRGHGRGGSVGRVAASWSRSPTPCTTSTPTPICFSLTRPTPC